MKQNLNLIKKCFKISISKWSKKNQNNSGSADKKISSIFQENANSKFLPLGIDERFTDFSKELNESSAINYIYGGTLTYQFDISNAVEAIDSLK